MINLTGYASKEQIYRGNDVAVFRAVRLKDQVPVVIKYSLPDAPKEILDQFHQEWEIGQHLELENVVFYHELLPYEEGLALVVEDFGAVALADVIPSNGLDIANFLAVAIQLAKGLHALHEKNIVHAHITPRNVGICLNNGLIKLLDLGESLRLDIQSELEESTQRETRHVEYISPEQTGQVNRTVDHRSDLYSLGVALYELLCGSQPYQAGIPEEYIKNHLFKPPTPLHSLRISLPQALVDIVMKLLEKNPDDRYQRASGLRVDLEYCLYEWNERRDIRPFRLGAQDFSETFQISQKLYGRAEATMQLQEVLETIKEGPAQMAIVSGYPGVGKSSLIDEILKNMPSKKGAFVSGRFDPFRGRGAYDALLQAFNALVQHLLQTGETQLPYWKEQILGNIGNNGQLLIDLMPDLELIIGPQPPLSEWGALESVNRFFLTIHQFLKACATPKHPLFIFLDDFQWADSDSLDLIRYLLTEPELGHCLLVASYRDSEGNTHHPSLIMIDHVEQARKTLIPRVALEPLDIKSTRQLIADALSCSLEKAEILTEYIFRKTEGNPFFVKLFLQMLHDENLLTFVSGAGWQADMEKIGRLQSIDTVQDLAMRKMSLFSESIQSLLKAASCLGSRFSLRTLSWIVRKTPGTIIAQFQPVLKSGLLIQTDDCFSFVHDSIQEAVYIAFANNAKLRTHLEIGVQMLENYSSTEKEENIFEIVGHLNQGQSLIKDNALFVEQIRLNLLAGQKSKRRSALSVARLYYDRGIACLGSKGWKENYGLALTLHQERSTTDYTQKDFEHTKQFISSFLPQIRSDLKKAELYHLLSRQAFSHSRHEDCLEMGEEALKLLGIELPKHNLTSSLTEEYDHYKKLLGNRSIESLIDAEPMTKTEERMAVRVLLTIQAAAYRVSPELYSVITVKLVNLTLTHGHTEESAKVYVTYSNVLIEVLEEYQQGYDFCHLGLRFTEHYQDNLQKCRVYFIYLAYLCHWIQPLNMVKSAFNEGYQAGLESGDFQYAGYILGLAIPNLYHQGTRLDTLLEKLDQFLAFVQKTHNRVPLETLQGFLQILENLTGKTKDRYSFDRPGSTEVQFLENCLSENRLGIFYFHTIKAQLLFLYEEPERALQSILKAKKILPVAQSTAAITEFNFLYSLILTNLLPDASEDQRALYWKQLEVNQRQLEAWEEHCEANFQHKYALVAAEMARVSQSPLQAMQYYDQAINSAMEHELPQIEALSNELAAKFWLELGKSSFAQPYLKNAYNGYRLWGAVHKFTMLEEQYPQLKQSKALPTAAPSIKNKVFPDEPHTFDLKIIIHALQTINGEVDQESLLKKIIAVVLKHTEAERGILLLEKQGKWHIEAEGSDNDPEVKVLQSLPLPTKEKEDSPLPVSIVEYVVRKKEPILLEKSSQSEDFKTSPYLLAHGTRAILCIPLAHQSYLSAILYLENSRKEQSFAPQHMEVLHMLAPQIAITLENAKLFSNMERFVPRDFLRLLKKDSVKDVELGDQVEKNMSVLFANIRRFTTFSEALSSHENFEFINSYLRQMEPCVTQNQGFIDAFIGDAIMALFPESADDAVQAAISIQQRLASYNKGRLKAGYIPLQVGIGIDTGDLMLGMIGVSSRIESSVIGDTVNLSARIEDLTKVYGTAILISDFTRAGLSNPDAYTLRPIDRVKLKGKEFYTQVYEVLDGETVEARKRKKVTIPLYEKALKFCQSQKFEQAKHLFESCLKRVPEDQTTRLHIKRCEEQLLLASQNED